MDVIRQAAEQRRRCVCGEMPRVFLARDDFADSMDCELLVVSCDMCGRNLRHLVKKSVACYPLGLLMEVRAIVDEWNRETH